MERPTTASLPTIPANLDCLHRQLQNFVGGDHPESNAEAAGKEDKQEQLTLGQYGQ